MDILSVNISDILMAMPGFLDGMGFSAIDKNLSSLLFQLDMYVVRVFHPVTTLAFRLSYLLVFVMLSWECIQMIGGYRMWQLGRILRPIALAFFISLYTPMTNSIGTIVNEPNKFFRSLADTENNLVATKEKQVALLSTEYKDSINSKLAQQKQLETEKNLNETRNGDTGFIDGAVNEIKIELDYIAKKSMIWIETKVMEVVNWILRFIGEIIWQMMYYGIIICAKFGWGVLYMFGPLAFAISIVPPFANAWSTWLARFINISLYPMLIFAAVALIDQMFIYSLNMDINMYTNLIHPVKGIGDLASGTDWSDIWALGMNNVGTTTSYVGALLAGSYAIKMVPEVASWIMPASAAQGLSEAASGFASNAVRITAGTVSTAAATVGTAASVATVGIAGAVAPVAGAVGGVIRTGAEQAVAYTKGAVGGAAGNYVERTRNPGKKPSKSYAQSMREGGQKAWEQHVDSKIQQQYGERMAKRAMETQSAFDTKAVAENKRNMEEARRQAEEARRKMDPDKELVKNTWLNMKVKEYGGDPSKMSINEKKKFIDSHQKTGAAPSPETRTTEAAAAMAAAQSSKPEGIPGTTSNKELRESVRQLGGNPDGMSRREMRAFIKEKGGQIPEGTRQAPNMGNVAGMKTQSSVNYAEQAKIEMQQIREALKEEGAKHLEALEQAISKMEQHNSEMQQYINNVNNIIALKNISPAEKQMMLLKANVKQGIKAATGQVPKAGRTVKSASDKIVRGTNFIMGETQNLTGN